MRAVALRAATALIVLSAPFAAAALPSPENITATLAETISAAAQSALDAVSAVAAAAHNTTAHAAVGGGGGASNMNVSAGGAWAPGR